MSEQWYFDLKRNTAVPASQRGPGDDMLGPYPTRADAENWRSKVEQRNDTWDDDDATWNDDEKGEEKGEETGR